MTTFHRANAVRVAMPREALGAVFDECDGFDRDETGGRLIGTFAERAGELVIRVGGIIESGPSAKRTNVSFFQDGAHQERVFREIERGNPEIEHLGNWHTHHVNGYPTLSGGDVETYHRIVNHKNHNIPFFYALLVNAKTGGGNPLERYRVRHYLLRRGDRRTYEIPSQNVELVDAPLLWPKSSVESRRPPVNGGHETPMTLDTEPRPARAHDSDVLNEFYPGIRTFKSPQLGIYWRGSVDLVDGSSVQVVVVEDASESALSYTIALRQPDEMLKPVAQQLELRRFASARAAVILAERACNHAIYNARGRSRGVASG